MVKGAIKNMEELYQQGVIPREIYEARMASLKRELEACSPGTGIRSKRPRHRSHRMA